MGETVQNKFDCLQSEYSFLLQQNRYNSEFVEIVNNKMHEFEKQCAEWDVKTVVTWIKIIDNGYFDWTKYERFIDKVMEMNITGNTLPEMNSKILLKSWGLDEESQRVLLKNINRICVLKKQEKSNKNIC